MSSRSDFCFHPKKSIIDAWFPLKWNHLNPPWCWSLLTNWWLLSFNLWVCPWMLVCPSICLHGYFSDNAFSSKADDTNCRREPTCNQCQYLISYAMVLDALTAPGDAMGFSCWVNQGLISASTLFSFLMRRRLVMSGWWWVGAFMLHGGYGGSGGRSPDGWIWRWELLSAVADQMRCLRRWVCCAHSLMKMKSVRRLSRMVAEKTQLDLREIIVDEITHWKGWLIFYLAVVLGRNTIG